MHAYFDETYSGEYTGKGEEGRLTANPDFKTRLEKLAARYGADNYGSECPSPAVCCARANGDICPANISDVVCQDAPKPVPLDLESYKASVKGSAVNSSESPSSALFQQYFKKHTPAALRSQLRKFFLNTCRTPTSIVYHLFAY